MPPSKSVLRERGYTPDYYLQNRDEVQAWHYRPAPPSFPEPLYNFGIFGKRIEGNEPQLDHRIFPNWAEWAQGRTIDHILSLRGERALPITTNVFLTYAMYQIQNFHVRLDRACFEAVEDLVRDFWWWYHEVTDARMDLYAYLVTRAYVKHYQTSEMIWQARDLVDATGRTRNPDRRAEEAEDAAE